MSKEALYEVYRHPLLHKQDLDAICEKHTLVEFRKGEFLLKEGQISNEYFNCSARLSAYLYLQL